jgi:hypothetical protein
MCECCDCCKCTKKNHNPFFCERLRREFEANNPTFYEDPDPFAADYNIYFSNHFSAPSPCPNLPNIGIATTDELEITNESFQVNGKYLCPMLVWARLSGQLVRVLFRPGSSDPVTVVDTNPSPRARAYTVCIQTII